MNRRRFFSFLGAIPFLSFLKPKEPLDDGIHEFITKEQMYNAKPLGHYKFKIGREALPIRPTETFKVKVQLPPKRIYICGLKWEPK